MPEPQTNHDTLAQRVKSSADQHHRKASEYEAAGNVEGAMYLRYVANLLCALHQGHEGQTILP